MPSDKSARLRLPYVAAGQMQKHVTVNEALTQLDVLIQTAVLSRRLAAQPASPIDGSLYILPPGATGSAWSDWPAGSLVRAEFGGWTRVSVPNGALVIVVDEGSAIYRQGSTWLPLGVFEAEVQRLTRFGLGTDADDANPFAARLNKALWTAREVGEGGDGCLRFAFNKASASDVGSVLFQTGYSGRAEIGLIGDDDLSLKVSADGETWREAFRIGANDGRVEFLWGAVRAETVLRSSSGSISPPPWASTVRITAIGGGGGGATGAFGPVGDRLGGSGGGSGGVSEAVFSLADLPRPLDLTIGAGGPADVDGQDTVVSAGGVQILKADGGVSGGAGGRGLASGNAGGVSSVSAPASEGGSMISASAPGGGGGGGGLDAGDAPWAAGDGGVGGAMLCPAPGGAPLDDSIGGAGSPASIPQVCAAGGGGGGGAAAASGTGLNGAAGGDYGAGGGGGGAGLTGGGAGGAGASGLVLIRWFG